jgi:hypothetical protein
LNGAVSKTVVARWATVGSNPTLSANPNPARPEDLGLTGAFS